MNNEPVAWMALNELNGSYSTFTNDQKQRLLPHISQCYGKWIPLYTHPHPDNLGLAESIIKQQELQIEALKAHSVKELNDGGEPVKNATYWKRQYNLMATQNDNLKSGLYHANEQIKYLESHPVKEQRMIDILMELAKYRLLSKEEIEEVVILRKAQDD